MFVNMNSKPPNIGIKTKLNVPKDTVIYEIFYDHQEGILPKWMMFSERNNVIKINAKILAVIYNGIKRLFIITTSDMKKGEYVCFNMADIKTVKRFENEKILEISNQKA